MNLYKKLLLILTLICLVAGCAPPDATDIYGKPVHFSSLKGQWIVVHYWASWCAPCIREIPILNKLAAEYKGKVAVFGVNPDNLTDDVLRNLNQAYRVNYLFLKSFPLSHWGIKIKQLPETVIIDPEGKLYKTFFGPVSFATFQATMHLPNVAYE